MAKYRYRYTDVSEDEYLVHISITISERVAISLGLLTVVAPKQGQGHEIRESDVERVRGPVQDEDVAFVVGGSC